MSLTQRQIEALLQRPCLVLEDKADFPELTYFSSFFKDKTVLITGAGGSIGSALAKQLAYFSPKHLILLDIYENHLFYLGEHLKQAFPQLSLTVKIASVIDSYAMEKLLSQQRVDVIFHAAAHKHVPLMQAVPHQAIKNNLGGTWTLGQLSKKYEVPYFVLVSTDKAVQVKNYMGYSKWLCEQALHLLQAENKHKTQFSMVRFGNVLGSFGSVLPLFQKKIEEQQALQLTDKAMKRYFITEDEAVHLLLNALRHTVEIQSASEKALTYVLEMEPSVSIEDFARTLLSFYPKEQQVEIEYTGLRAGETLFEKYLTEHECAEKTDYKALLLVEDLKKREGASAENLKQVREHIERLLVSAHEEKDSLLLEMQAVKQFFER